jgi:hypothetical protein
MQVVPQPAPANKGGSTKVALGRHLADLGVKFDCYFTFEEMPQNGGLALDLDDVDEKLSNGASSLDEALDELAGELKRFRLLRAKENPAVVHIIDVRLDKLNDYPLEKRTDVDCSGRILDLVAELDVKLDHNIRNKKWLTPHEMRFLDLTTQVNVTAKGATARRILTDFVPLSSYSRVLWTAETELVEGKPLTEVMYRGRAYHGPTPHRFIPEELQRNGIVDFSLGELAYANNPLSFNPADPEQNTANQAIVFIRQRMRAGDPLQVRWAMLFLGKFRVSDGIPVLMEYVDYRYTTCGILEESYPAVKALTQIGPPAADAALTAIPHEPNELRRRLFGRVLVNVHGLDQARQLVADAAARAEDDTAKDRLREALRACEKKAD